MPRDWLLASGTKYVTNITYSGSLGIFLIATIPGGKTNGLGPDVAPLNVRALFCAMPEVFTIEFSEVAIEENR